MNVTKSKDNVNDYIINAFGGNDKKCLIAYFSWGGNTRHVSEYIKSITGADIFEIAALKEYSKNYRTTTEEARHELDSDYLPELKNKLTDISLYNTVILGYPNWWGTMPQAVKKFLLDCNMTGKTIMPICTHGGGGEGRSISDIKKLCPNSNISKALVLNGGSVLNSNERIKDWLNNISVIVK